MIQYSVGTIINRVFTPATRQGWVNNVTQAVSDAGWTTISGTPGSGSDVTMETAANNVGASIRARFLEPGSGNCAQTFIKNSSGTLVSQAMFLNPGSTWRVIANKFHFFAYVSATPNQPNGWVFGGTLWTPTFLNYSSGDAIGWMICGGDSDVDAANRVSWRLTLNQPTGSSGFIPRWSTIQQGVKIDKSGGSGAQIGDPTIPVWQSGTVSTDNGYRWKADILPIYEPFPCFATGAASNNEARMKGQLYDAIVVNGQWANEATIALDSHTWMNITSGPTTNVAKTACLFLAVT